MFSDYFSKKEAEKNKNLLISKMNTKFCPLIKDMCKTTNCVCFFEGSISEKKNSKQTTIKYRLHHPQCGSPLISGEIYVNNNF